MGARRARFLGVLLLSPLVRLYWPRSKRLAPQLYFIADDEIADEEEDLLENGGSSEVICGDCARKRRPHGLGIRY